MPRASEDIPTIPECDKLAMDYLTEYRRGFWQYQKFLEIMDIIFDRRLVLMREEIIKAAVNDPEYTKVVS